ncbi:MAG: 30S ribosomal protein S5 [Thermodesulfobacteriota bacterium]
MREKIDPSGLEIKEKIVHVRRVSKVTKGGKRFHFTALVVIGNNDGIVGFGLGKSSQVPDAIRKGVDKGKKNLIRVQRNGKTIPHEILGHHASTRVLLKPASPGTGVIAGGAVRAVVQLAGIQDILSKVMGSTNPLNVVEAVINGLSSVRRPEEVAKIRGKELENLDLPKFISS